VTDVVVGERVGVEADVPGQPAGPPRGGDEPDGLGDARGEIRRGLGHALALEEEGDRDALGCT
jgi:hypothetical protein